ncbi:efflux transporter outer membrane subunit [Capnocytophaga felis]|uniref:Multidrug transporter n=1 Tax=Capnocytophaga felis TaxID=2267611 RepID=A0A5M4B6D9_9FLAO|nr:TolC family protein [Capnocytophaga felis]GET44847.1 multidrug transporter [Capnocytophaga felis]GET48626.1 multidrug transporter [Capnocytophaga felis]
MNIFKIIGVTIATILLTSCAARKNYERPQVADSKLFRSENISADSLSSAVVSWKDIFTDKVLQQHINKALTKNLDIRVALQNVASAQAYLKQSRNAFLPSISASGSYTRNTASLNVNPLQTERSYNNVWDITVNASWEADIWGKLNAQNKASYASYLATVSAHQAVQSEVIATLATAYYQLLMYDRQREILQETIKLRQAGLETTQALKDAGITTEVAVQQTQALLYNAQSQLITINNAVWALENSIAILLAENPQDIERTRLDEQQFPTDFKQGYPVSLLENRPDVKRAEYNLMNAFELTNVARTGFYPSLTLTARTGVTSTDIEQWFSVKSIFANFIAGLTQPIFNRRQVRTQYEVSKANKEIALLGFQKTILMAGKEVSDAMQNFASQEEFIQLKQKETEAYQKATDYSKELFNSGMASYLEVITSEVNRLNAELSLANAKFMRMQYGITLYKALGGGWR